MDSPVSVIIPTFNRDHLLDRCLKSVLAAIRNQDEIIVVNNGDSDDTSKVTAAFDDPRIRYVRQRDGGVSASRNLGMAMSGNDLVAFIDDDDEWHPQKLNVQRQLLAMHPETVACFTNMWATDANGVAKHDYLFEWGQPVQNWNQLLGEARTIKLNEFDQDLEYYVGDHYFNQMLDDYVLPSSLIINRAKFSDDLKFRVGMQRNESWLFSSQVCRQGQVVYVDFDMTCQHGDAVNRLTSLSQLDTVLSKLFVLENEFGSNEAFVSQYGAEFRKRLDMEASALFRAAMRRGVSNRKQVLVEHARLGGRIAKAASLPDVTLSVISLGYQILGRSQRILRSVRGNAR